MRVFLLIISALIAFAANSILNRAALSNAGMDPAVFSGIRLMSGAIVLWALVGLRGGLDLAQAGSWKMAGALALYATAFSYAYVTLDAGIGALILFAGVQITMFGGAILPGDRPGLLRWAGSALGLVGLAVLYLPGAPAPAPGGVLLMLMAAFGWGAYSLMGRRAGPPLRATAGNFCRAAPVGLGMLAIGALSAGRIGPDGVVLAVLSGAVASGMGYAIWYSVLPRIDASRAAIWQLTVPLFAVAGGAAFLGEMPDPVFFLSALLVLGGVALSLVSDAKPTRNL